MHPLPYDDCSFFVTLLVSSHCYVLFLHRIKHTYILDDPFDDPSQLAELIPDASPEGKPKDEVMAESKLLCQ